MTTAIDPGAAITRLAGQLEMSQWASPAEIASSQCRHVRLLAEHCVAQSPAFARRLDSAGLRPEDLGRPEIFSRLPVMTRRDVQAAGEELFCRDVPAGHGSPRLARTSGSTGEPVQIRRTAVTGVFWRAMALREMRWHQRDLSGRLCSIRPNHPAYELTDDWGAFAPGDRTGPALRLPSTADAARLVDWITEFDPTVLAVFPSVLRELTGHCRKHGVELRRLRHILTVGETLTDAVRADARATFAADIADCYSSEEFGYIATQCPASGLYHVMAESVLAEVLDDQGQPCREGEVGRVTLTALHNYATPLIRYDIGDMAEPASPCPCGRGLPAWRRILGRTKNLLLRPDGTRCWPVTGFFRCRDIAPVAQYQLIQLDARTIEARLVVERALLPSEEQGLRALVNESVGYADDMRFAYFEGRLPVGPSGKCEEFLYAGVDPVGPHPI